MVGEIIAHAPGKYLVVRPFHYSSNNPVQTRTPTKSSPIAEIPKLKRLREEPHSPTPAITEAREISPLVTGGSDIEELLEETIGEGEKDGDKPARKSKKQNKGKEKVQ